MIIYFLYLIFSSDTVPDSSKLSRIEAARGAALQAEKKLHFSKRNLQKLQLNNDLSFAYILNMFESKEMRKRLSVKSCFQKLIKLLTSLYRNIQKQHEDILTKAQALDPELDIREFVRRTYNDEPCTSFHLPEETDVDLGYHLADLYGSASSRATIAEHCKVLLHTGYSYVRALCAFFEENAKLEEDSCKQIRKFSWNIHTDLQCSMLVACETWDNFVINLSHSFEKYALAFRSLVISEMSNLLTEYKGEMETIIKKFVKINREVEPMYVAKDKAENDAKKTASGLSNLKEKLNRTFVSNSDKDKTKKVIPLPFQASSDKIAQKIHSAEIEAQSAKRDLQTAVHILEKTREKEISQVYELAQMTKNLEFRRVERIKVIISSLAQIFAEFDNAIKEDLDMLNSNTESIDPQKDIDVFIQRSSVGISPPEWVLEDFHRQLVEEMEEKAERNLVSNRSSLSNFGETKDTFASRTMASEIFNALSTHEKLSTNVFSPKSEVLPSSPVSTLKLLSMRFGQVTKKVSIRSKEASLERKKHESSSLLGASQSIRKKPLPSIPLAPEDFTSPVLAENNQSSIRWRQHLDASSGEFYYEDLNSGQTTWDIPSEEFYPYENFES